jgi:hypothetical protein
MRIVTGTAAVIGSGKAHKLADFQGDSDVTLVRIENLSEGHALEIFTEEGATTTVNSYIIPAKVSEKTPSFLTVPYQGGAIYGSGVGATVSFRIIGVVPSGNVGIATGTA